MFDVSDKISIFSLRIDEIPRQKFGYEILECVPNIPDSFDDQLHTISNPSDRKLEPCIVEVHPSMRTLSSENTKLKTIDFEATENVKILNNFIKCDTSDKIINFAQQYGRLTETTVLLPDSISGSTKHSHFFSHYPGEPISLWEKERHRLNEAITLWKAYQKTEDEKISIKRNEYLRKHIYFTDEIDDSQYCKDALLLRKSLNNAKTMGFRSDDYLVNQLLSTFPEGISMRHILFKRNNKSMLIAGDGDKNTHFLMKHIPWGNYEAAARIMLYQIINEMLKNYPAESKLRFDNEGNLKIQIVTETLLSKLWMIFAETMTDGCRVRLCPVCNELFKVSSIYSRQKQHPECGNDKRVTASRARKHKKMVTAILNEISQGKSIEEIAQNIGKKPHTIQKWIKSDHKEVQKNERID